MNLDANELYQKLIDAGNDWAEKQAAYNVLDDTRQAVLAKLTLASDAPSVAAREIEAKSSAAYEEHVKTTQEAFAAALKAKVKYNAIQVWIDLRRTEAANERAAMKLA
jgi:hypothetical protein